VNNILDENFGIEHLQASMIFIHPFNFMLSQYFSLCKKEVNIFLCHIQIFILI